MFRFATRIIVMVGGRILVEGTPDEIAADPRVREVYLGGAAVRMAEPLLAFDDVRAGYGDSVVLDDVSFDVAGERQPRGARAQRRRQDRRCCSPSWATRTSRAARSSWRGEDITRLAAAPPRARGHRLGGAGARDFPSLTVEENLDGRRRGRAAGISRAVYELFPRLAERQRRHGQSALRRRAADAGDRARADDQSGAAAARRAAGGPRADHRRGTDRRDPAHERAKTGRRSCWSSSTPRSRCR